MNILIAEDEKDLRELLKDNLIREGYTVLAVEDGEKAWEILNEHPIDLCILDVMMPRLSGLELVQRLRNQSNIPVIFLTAKVDEMDRLLGFSLGCDDYLAKPFSMSELKARVRVQARHFSKEDSGEQSLKKESNCLICGEISLNLEEASCYKSDRQILLGTKEYLLLKLFMQHQGKVFTKKQLYHNVWKEDFLYDDNTVMVHLSRLRNKLEDNPKAPEYILTIRGIGYKMNKMESENRKGIEDEE